MATLAIAAVGSAIGASIGGSFLGVAAATWGWNIGALAGGYLFGGRDGKNVVNEGARLGDLRVQSSAYGQAIPRVYGAFRIAGNMIWSESIAETQHSSTQHVSNGKGRGGGDSVTNVSYSYAQSFAIALCEGPIVGVRKIWANGRLIYNLGANASIKTIRASNRTAAGIRVHTGAESQLADALIEASVGAGNAPAYRGTAYIVFENLQLADYGNATPNIEVEVVGAGSLAAVAYGAAYSSGAYMRGYSSFVSGGVHYGLDDSDAGAHVNVAVAGGYQQTVLIQDVQTAATLSKDYYTTTDPLLAWFLDDPYAGVWWDGITPLYINIWRRSVVTDFITLPFTPAAVWCYGSADCGVVVVWQYGGTAIGLWSIRWGNVVDVKTIDSGGLSSALWSVAVRHADRQIFTLSLNTVTQYDDNWIQQAQWVDDQGLLDFELSVGAYKATMLDDVLAVSISNHSSSPAIQRFIRLNDDGTMTHLGDASGQADCTPHYHTRLTRLSVLAQSRLANGEQQIIPAPPLLSDVVGELCESAGIGVGDYDVSDLAADTLHGYLVPARGPVRAAIEPLMQAFAFDAVESDGVLKFVKRGGASAATIEEADLGARPWGSATGDAATLERTQESELPLEVALAYADKDSGYRTGTQYARRLTGASENKQALSMALALSAAQAKTAADRMLYDAWQGRTAFRFAVASKYSHLEPCDVIDIAKGGAYYTCRIVAKSEQQGVISLEAVHEDLQIYDQAASPATLPAPDEDFSEPCATLLHLLDIPLLRDSDDGIGVYAAACGYTDEWQGAQVYKSTDGELTWARLGNALLGTAAIGQATTVLGDWQRDIFDETNTVTVRLVSDVTLSGATRTQVRDGTNWALLGDEIIAFRTATLTAERTYVLSGLLRGRRGTEWAAATHAVADRFILLDEGTTGLLRVPSSEINTARDYRGASLGGYLSDALTQEFTYQGVGLECYAPVNVGGGRNSSADVLINWRRRGRIANEWTDYADIPLGEGSESYEIDILDGVTVVRTLTAATETATYTAAQQAADFGGTQSAVAVMVYQLSATVGRGRGAAATV